MVLTCQRHVNVAVHIQTESDPLVVTDIVPQAVHPIPLQQFHVAESVKIRIPASPNTVLVLFRSLTFLLADAATQ